MTRLFKSQRCLRRPGTRFAEFQPHVPKTSSPNCVSAILSSAEFYDAVTAEGSGTFQLLEQPLIDDDDQPRCSTPPSIEPPIIVGGSSMISKAKTRRRINKEVLIKQAEQGDTDAMMKVGRLFSRGMNGFPQDDEKAYLWYKRAQAAGNVPAMAKMGELLVLGQGVRRDEGKGVVYLALAAQKGSNFAAYLMGECLADGQHGVPVDLVEARRMLELALSDKCAHNHMHVDMKEEAREKLNEVLSRMQQ